MLTAGVIGAAMTDDLLAALTEALAAPEEDAQWLTAREMRARGGHSANFVYSRLRQLADAGRLEVRDVRRVRLDGRVSVVPGYRLKSPAD